MSEDLEAHMGAEENGGALCKNRNAYFIDQGYTLDFDVIDTPILFWNIGVTCYDCIKKILRLKGIDSADYDVGEEARHERYKAASIAAGTWN